MSNTMTQDINPDDYKCSGKISRLFSVLAGRELRSAEFLVARPDFRKACYAQIIAKERKGDGWDVIEKITTSYFGTGGWHDGDLQLNKLLSGVSREAAVQEIKAFEDKHQRPLDQQQVQNGRKNRLNRLFR